MTADRTAGKDGASRSGSWLTAVSGRQTKAVLNEGVLPQRWWTVACWPECRNSGPWAVYGPGSEAFFCVVCKKKMSVTPFTR